MEKYLTLKQIDIILRNAPPELQSQESQEGIIQDILNRGYKIERYNDYPEPGAGVNREFIPGFKEQPIDNTGFGSSVTEKIGNFTGGTKIAQGLGQALAAPGNNKMLDEATARSMQTQTDLIQRIKEKKARGENTLALEKALADIGGNIKNIADQTEGILNPNQLTTKQVVGDALQLGTTIVGAGTLPGAAKNVVGAKTIGQGILQGAKTGAIAGTGFGAASGVAQGLKNDEDALGIAKSGAIGGVAGGVGGAVIGGAIGSIGGIVSKVKANKNPFSTAEEAFDAIKPKLTQKEVSEKARAGLISFDTKGNYIEKPSGEELRLSNVAKNIFTPKQNTAQKIGVIQKQIADISEKEVLPLLRNSQVGGTLDDVYKYIDQIQPTKQFAKKLNPNAFEAFNTIKNDSKNVIANAMKAEIKKDPNVNFNEALWLARQRIDDLIEEQFGASAFDDPLKNSAREASVKARTAVQNFLIDSVSGRDMSKMAQARNVVSESVKRGIDIPEGQTVDDLVEDIYRQLGGEDVNTNPVIQEARKYKSAEEFVKAKIEKNNFTKQDQFLMEIPTKDIAHESLKSGVKSGRKVELPIEAEFNVSDGTWRVVDGQHRLEQALANGDKNIKAKVSYVDRKYGSNQSIISDRDLTKTQLTDLYNKAVSGAGDIQPETSKLFAERMKYLRDLYTIKDNYLAPRLGKEDPSAIQRLFKKYPKSTKAGKTLAVLGAGTLAGDFLFND